jgi:hypothetical protein
MGWRGTTNRNYRQTLSYLLTTFGCAKGKLFWIPAFAGMTNGRFKEVFRCGCITPLGD